MTNDSPKKILIVDDQMEVLELLVVTLEVSSHQLFTACNGTEALEIAQHEQPHLILLDVMMSNRPSGLEVCRQLKQGATQEVPTVIMLTAQGQTEDIEAGYEAGADDYLVKPFSPLELIEKVIGILGE